MSQRRACGLIGISESSYRYQSTRMVVPELKELLLQLVVERPRYGYIQPGKSMQNAFVESFTGRFRDECLNEHWFQGLEQAREVIEEWRLDNNQVRPHSSLGDLPPEEYPSLSERKWPGTEIMNARKRAHVVRSNLWCEVAHGSRVPTYQSWRPEALTEC